MPETPPENRGLANLRPPWKPGETGNPKGRPKGRSLTTMIREVLDQDTVEGLVIPEGKTAADVFCEALVVHAINGNSAYMREVMDRMEGKVKDSMQTEGVSKIIVEYAVADAMIEAGLKAAGVADFGPDDNPRAKAIDDGSPGEPKP